MSNPSVIHQSTSGDNVVVTILETQMRDQETVQRIREALLQAVNSGTFRNAVIDLAHVQFIGSVGFLAFLSVRRVPGITNVVLCNMSDNLRELFSICKLIPTSAINSAPFLVADDVESAIEMLI